MVPGAHIYYYNTYRSWQAKIRKRRRGSIELLHACMLIALKRSLWMVPTAIVFLSQCQQHTQAANLLKAKAVMKWHEKKRDPCCSTSQTKAASYYYYYYYTHKLKNKAMKCSIAYKAYLYQAQIDRMY